MVRVRIAPSPTGEDLHIGNLYTALINWAFAKKYKGKFIIRIEDTDQERLVPGSEEKILSTLKAYGLSYDEGPDIGGPYSPYRQSERLSLYQKYAKELIEKDYAYYCFCTKERLDTLRKKQNSKGQISRYDRHCLNNVKNPKEKLAKGERFVIRLKVLDNKTVWFKDIIHGEIKFDSNQLDDQILIKSDGYPTYHLGVVVDDHLMEITHIIRAEEWISSTPKHIILYEAFKWDVPFFAHIPILRNPDKSKLSKRKNPVWASWYLEQGYMSEAMLNYLALMGWNHPEGKDIFSIDDFIKYFDLKDINSAGPIFDIVKLSWMNGEYIRKTDNSKLKTQIWEYLGKKYSEGIIEKSIPLIKDRIKKLSDYLPLCEFFFKEPEAYEVDLSGKKDMFGKIKNALKNLTKWTAIEIGESMQKAAKDLGVKNSEFFMLLRVAVTGKKISPPLNESMEILGKEKVLERIDKLL